MVDQEIFLRRLEALRDYLRKVRAFQATRRDDFIREETVHDLAERYLHLMMECVLDLGNYLRIDHGLAWDAITKDVTDIEAFYAWAIGKAGA